MKIKAIVKYIHYTELAITCDGGSLGVKVGDEVSVDIKKWSPSRSLGQNAIWHKLLGMIAEKTGNDLDVVKQFVKNEHGLRVEFRGEWIPKPSSQYEKKEWQLLMEPTIALAIEYGVDTSWL